MHQKEVSAVLTELQATEKGLSSHQATQRLHKHGFNEIQKQKFSSPLKILLQQFASPLVWILIVALIISIVLHEELDAIVIGVIIVLNAILGFTQEYRAERAIEALQKLASPKAKVLRNGKEVKIESKYLVPGDIILLETGDKIPADARLIEVHDLQTQEGPLTGESQPVAKLLTVLKAKTPLADRTNMVYASTVVTKGRARAVVTHTAMHTQVGKIATLIEKTETKVTPLQKKLRQLGKYLTIAVVIVAVIVFLAGLLSGQSASSMLLTAIALAVAAIPEGLPAVITISLALGVQRMVKRHSLVRKLPSVETLGSVNVICTDKTGTLTHNQMTVTKIWANNQVYEVSGSGYEPKGDFTTNKKKVNASQLTTLLTIGATCNDAKIDGKKVLGDPTEAALLVVAKKGNILPEKKRVDEIGFTSERKMMTTIHQGGVSFTKGSPDIVLEKCTKILLNGKVERLTREMRKKITAQNEEFASHALRVLAFALNKKITKETAERGMIFVGLQAMIDPPRREVKKAISTCTQAGIRVVMITGDQIATAVAIGKELGITGKAITGQDLEHTNLHKQIEDINIFARVNPEHKLEIVEALKHKGYVVAMTGDGVNDAPALKKADIGISMGITGTDVAKEASDMILTDDNFTSIVNAVEEGRGIFDNIRKFVNYLLSCNLGEVAVIFFASIYSTILGTNLGLPLTAIQILWVNLITDGLPATALSVDPHTKDIMKRKPRSSNEGILSRTLRADIITFGILIGIFSLVLFILYQGSGLMKAQTMVFTSLVTFELVRLQTIRSEHKLKMLSNKPLVWAVVVSLVLHLATLYTPLNNVFKTVPLALMDWVILIIASGILYVIYRTIHKFVLKKKFGAQS